MVQTLAVDGGTPVRSDYLAYGRQAVDEADIRAVVDVLRSDYLTTGPKVGEYETTFAAKVGATHAIAVNSGTAALHAAVYAADIGPGDEVIVTPLTFAATANCIVYQGGSPIFVDVQADTLNIDPAAIEQAITPRTKAIIAVDFSGQPCDYEAIRAIATEHNLVVIEDAAHALGATYQGQPIGTVNELTTFSTHPVKHITTGEGGVITTDDERLAFRMQYFRNHGITTNHQQRFERGGWFYEMVDLGYNYRIPDILCALGMSQLKKLDTWIERRQAIAEQYTRTFASWPELETLQIRPDVGAAWHIYPIMLCLDRLRVGRAEVFEALRAENIGVNVHYIPVHQHPYYRETFGPISCPIADAAYERLVTLPLFPTMSDEDITDVITALDKVITAYRA